MGILERGRKEEEKISQVRKDRNQKSKLVYFA